MVASGHGISERIEREGGGAASVDRPSRTQRGGQHRARCARSDRRSAEGRRVRKRLAAAALISVCAAYQMSGRMVLTAADPLVSHATFGDFFPPEGSLRWSTDRSTLVFPDPGPGIPVRVEVFLSAWRPPGKDG